MTRFMLMRQGDAEPQLIPETPLPLEKDLHDVLTLHPALLPAEDLGLGRVVVAGRESSLVSGYADLVLIDEQGHLCVVEVKKAGNPDTRQVVAQLLDYAAALWGQSIAEFEAGVVVPYLATLGADAPGSLLDHVAALLDDELEGGEDRARFAIDRLAQTLETGEFTLVVAAAEIPLGVQRVLEYLNARGQRFFAIEVSYFKGPAECFVPRLVVMPPVTAGATSGTTPPMEPDVFLTALPAHARGPVESFIAAALAAGAEVAWLSYGPSFKVTRDKTRQVAYFEIKRYAATIQASGGFPEEPFAEVAHRLLELGVGAPKSWWHIVPWSEMTEEQATEALGILLDGIAQLTSPHTLEPLQPARLVAFERNDHNVWTKSVPELGDLHGRRLRGTLKRLATGDAATVELLPLKGNAAGWRPRFPGGEVELLWPTGVYDGAYELLIELASA
jgi:hypothetical protein